MPFPRQPQGQKGGTGTSQQPGARPQDIRPASKGDAVQTVYDIAFATLQFSTLTSTCAREEKIRKRGLTRGETQRKKIRGNGCFGGERTIKGHGYGEKEGKGVEVQMKKSVALKQSCSSPFILNK